MSLSELFNLSDHGRNWGDIPRVIVSLSKLFNLSDHGKNWGDIP